MRSLCRLALVLALVGWAVPAWAQRSVTVPRAVVPVSTTRCSAPLLHLGADGRVTASASLLDAHRLDTRRRFRLRIEQAPAETGPWSLLAEAETWGTPQRVAGVDPSVSTEAPANGWWSRSCVITGDRSIDTGLSVTASPGPRLPRRVAQHNSVAVDTDVEVSGTSVGTLTTGNMTVAGTDRVGVAGVTWRQTGINLSSVTIATVSASAVSGAAASSGSNIETAVWCAIAPSTGTQTASATFSDTWGSDLALMVSTYTGADQTTPCQDGNAATGTSTTASVTVANATADDYVVDAVIVISTSETLAADANQTSTAEFDPNGNVSEGMSQQDGADGGVMSWTLDASAAWATAAVRVVAAAGAGGGGPCLGALLGVGCDQ